MTISWIHSNAHSGIPQNAFAAGNDIDGATIYVGRAWHNGDNIPAKVIPSKHVAYVAYGGAEVAKYEYEVLTGYGFQWVRSADGLIPPDAVVGGQQSNGETLYVGRAEVRGSLQIGKMHPSHRCVYIPFDGFEHRIDYYEILVARTSHIHTSSEFIYSEQVIHRPITSNRSRWVSMSRHGPLPSGAALGGRDQDQSPMYIGRAWYNGDLLPAKVLPTKQAAYVAYDGREIMIDQFEVLCHGDLGWIRYDPRSNRVPANAVPGGQTSSNQTLYIGRTHHHGSETVGKIHYSHQALYIPFDGREVAIHSNVEILVEN